MIDQTANDNSIVGGWANPKSFSRMLRAALNENRKSLVVVKIHPDVWAGKKVGHFSPDDLKQSTRIQVLAEDYHPVSLLKNAEALYTVTSQLGFEGLLHGKLVRCFGMPFYAGWGLTHDDLRPPRRRMPASIEQLAHAALIKYPRYRSLYRKAHFRRSRVVVSRQSAPGLWLKFSEFLFVPLESSSLEGCL